MSAVDALRRSLEVPRVDVLAHVGAQTHWYRQRNPRLVDDGAMARFLASAGQAIRTDPRLMDCDPDSIVQALCDVAGLDFELGDARGQAWLAAVDGQAQMRLGYRGVIDLAGRSGIVLDVHDVHEKDRFEFWWGIEDHLVHAPYMGGARGRTTAWWAIARWRDGSPPVTHVMTRTDVEAHRDLLAARGDLVGAWTSHFDAMARRTVLLRLTNYLPIRDRAPQLAAAIATDTSTPAPMETQHAPAHVTPEHEHPRRDPSVDGRDAAADRDDRGTDGEGDRARLPAEEAADPRRSDEPPLLGAVTKLEHLARFNRDELFALAEAYDVEVMRAYNGKTLTAKLATYLPDNLADWRVTPSGHPF